MENSSIEWTDHTFNPWIGCQKVSPGCKNCYAEELMANRWKKAEWGPTGKRIKTSPNYWNGPATWDRKAQANGKKTRVFCASLADIFEDKADQPELRDWRGELFNLIDETPHLIWLLLTKRPENINRMLNGRTLTNAWYGTSVENQEAADTRIPELLNVPGKRFLSMEPLLDFVTLRPEAAGIHWVIVGGESGRNARPRMTTRMVTSIKNTCLCNDIPFFFKQWGKYRHETKLSWLYGEIDTFTAINKTAGAELHGRIIQQLPEEFKNGND